jgi:hypothetical protein
MNRNLAIGVGQLPQKLDKESETERVQIVAPSSWLRRIDAWRKSQPADVSRSAAIRALVDLGLEALKKKGKP